MKTATLAIRFLERLKVPEGPLAGNLIKLAPFQKRFVKGALEPGINVAVLSVGRGAAKTAISAGLGVGALLGVIDDQPRREIVIAARNRDQGRIAFRFCIAFVEQLIEDGELVADDVAIRQGSKLEIEWHGGGGGHLLRVVPADGRSALGGSPVLVIMDERGHWEAAKGDELEHALLSGIGKRGGRALIISTSAASDAHPFSIWLDQEQEGVYRQEHRPPPGLPADDLESLKEANPGAALGIGSSLDWLQQQARVAISRGGSTLTSFRLYNRNERVSAETRDVLLTVDEWLACETAEPPARKGQVVIGGDLGGSASMSAAAFYWPDTGRLEALGWFPSKPNLSDRGAADGVRERYVEMEDRGELCVLGDQTVPVAPWLVSVLQHVEGETVAAIVLDRFKQAEIGEAIDKTGIRAPLVWRGMGYKDGGEDCERFRRACYDGDVQSAPSLLLRSAFGDAVVLRDPANNLKLAKARSLGRIDAAAASVLAVAQGARMKGRNSGAGGRLYFG
ncbi:MAG: terminase TerL endonuclease subunit [Paracoccaceae bacterium]